MSFNLAADAWRALLVLGLAGALGACSRTEAERLQDAQRYFDQGQPQAGVVELKTVLQSNPDSADARLLLGKGLALSGDLAGASVELKRLRDAAGGDERVVPVLAMVMVGLGQYREALAAFGQVRLGTPAAAAELGVSLAQARLALGDADAAVVGLRTVLATKPDDQAAQEALARVLAARGQLEAARSMAKDMVSRKPQNADAWALVGDVALQEGPSGHAAATEAFRKALKLQADQSRAHTALVAMAVGRGDEAAAREQLQQMKAVLPQNPNTRFFDALMAMRDGNWSQAREQVQVLLQQAPANPRVLVLASQVEQAAGAPAQAENFLGRALLVEPSAPMPRHLLANLYLKTGRPAKALEILDSRARPGSRDLDAWLLAGHAHLALGSPAAADAAFAAAAKLAGSNAAVATGAALVQLAKGQTDAGLMALEAVSKTDPALHADLPLISRLISRGDSERALQAIDRYAAKLPKSPFADMLRAQAYLAKGDRVAARGRLEAALKLDRAYLPAVQKLAEMDWADGKPQAARDRFKAMLDADPKSVDAKVALADWTGRTGGAREDVASLLQEAIRARPNDPGLRLSLVDFALTSGDAPLALSTAQDAAAAMGDNPQVQERLGLAHRAAGDAVQAQTAFDRMAQLLPQSAAPHLHLAELKLSRQDVAGAQSHAKRAMELEPTLLQAKRVAVLVALRAGRVADAAPVVKALKQAGGADAAMGWQLEGEVELAQKHFAAAALAFGKALALKPSAETARLQHMALLGGGKAAEAEQQAQAWLKAHPDDLAFTLSLGEAALAQKDLVKAEAWFRKVLERQPRSVEALNNTAYVLALQGKGGAVELARQANRLAPNRPAVMDTLAQAYAANGQLQEAVDVQADVVARAPEVPEFRYTLARLLLKSGNKDAARQHLVKLSKYGQDYGRQAEVEALLKEL